MGSTRRGYLPAAPRCTLLYREAKKRIGDYSDDECFYFVPALALGGSDDAASVDRGNWRVHQSILIQT